MLPWKWGPAYYKGGRATYYVVLSPWVQNEIYNHLVIRLIFSFNIFLKIKIFLMEWSLFYSTLIIFFLFKFSVFEHASKLWRYCLVIVPLCDPGLPGLGRHREARKGYSKEVFLPISTLRRLPTNLSIEKLSFLQRLFQEHLALLSQALLLWCGSEEEHSLLRARGLICPSPHSLHLHSVNAVLQAAVLSTRIGFWNNHQHHQAFMDRRTAWLHLKVISVLSSVAWQPIQV